MKTIIASLLLATALPAADAPKPEAKKLTDTQKLRIREAQLAVATIETQLGKARLALQDAVMEAVVTACGGQPVGNDLTCQPAPVPEVKK